MELSSLITLLETYRYFILFPLACFEGPMLGFITGTLIPLGIFSPIPLLITLVLADVIPDIIYYFLGRWGKEKKFVHAALGRIGLHEERLELVRDFWHGHTAKAMLVTKFSYGISTPLLLTAGLVHLPFHRFWKWSAALAFLQYSILVSLGYFFGGFFAQVESALVRAQIIVAAVVVVFGLYFFFTKSVGKQALKEIKKQD